MEVRRSATSTSGRFSGVLRYVLASIPSVNFSNPVLPLKPMLLGRVEAERLSDGDYSAMADELLAKVAL
jgi:hypothetical protein